VAPIGGRKQCPLELARSVRGPPMPCARGDNSPLYLDSRDKRTRIGRFNDTNDPNHWRRRKADCTLPERHSKATLTWRCEAKPRFLQTHLGDKTTLHAEASRAGSRDARAPSRDPKARPWLTTFRADLDQLSPKAGCGRSSAISRSISWNICRGMATSTPSSAPMREMWTDVRLRFNCTVRTTLAYGPSQPQY
jgi:hypothetical protein